MLNLAFKNFVSFHFPSILINYECYVWFVQKSFLRSQNLAGNSIQAFKSRHQVLYRFLNEFIVTRQIGPTHTASSVLLSLTQGSLPEHYRDHLKNVYLFSHRSLYNEERLIWLPEQQTTTWPPKHLT